MKEFVLGLSVLARGTIQEKLFWAFSLYDINGDGLITREEMQDIVSAVYDLLGRGVEPTINERTAKDHAETVFKVRFTLARQTNLCLSDLYRVRRYGMRSQLVCILLARVI